MGFAEESEINIVLLSITEQPKYTSHNFTFIRGDARDMRDFKDKDFDVVFSNSVIQHVGGFDEQRRMAEEIRRVGKRYFLQTPNRFFPVEPHFLFPLFQFLPLYIRVFLISHFNIGWYKKTSNTREATKIATSIRLLTEREVRALFPNSVIYKEKLLGLTKSFLVAGGWGKSANN